MLKIKKSKWKEFCEKAKDFGFEIKNFNDGYGNIYKKSNIVTSDFDRILFGSGAVSQSDMTILFDLFEKGFVEKIEE